MNHAISRWRPLILIAAATVGLFLLLATPPASAHAVLESTTPTDGQVLSQPPKTLTVTFNENISLAEHGTALLDADGNEVPAQVTALNNTVEITPSGDLTDGTYILTWRVISADTHPVAGGITFSVGMPSGTHVDVPSQRADPQVGLLRATASTLRYIGAFGFVGLVFFTEFLCPPPVRESVRFAKQSRSAKRLFAILAIAASIVLVPLTQAWQCGDTLTGLTAASLWQDAVSSPDAIAALVLTIAVAACWFAAGKGATALVAAALAAALGSLIIEGHTRSFGPAWLVLPADLLHVSAGAIWFGGLIGLIVLLFPDRGLRSQHLLTAVSRFSTVAAVAVAALAVAAVGLWWRIAHSISALWTSTYGLLVLAKLVLVIVVVAVAAWNRFRLLPALAAGKPMK